MRESFDRQGWFFDLAKLFCSGGLLICLLGAFHPAGADPLGEVAGEPQLADPWKEYVLAGRYREGEEFFRQRILALFREGAVPAFKTLAELAYACDVCRRFPEIARSGLAPVEQRELTAWLLQNPEFTRSLLIALDSDDRFPQAFRIVQTLRQAPKRRIESFRQLGIESFRQLAIAFAIVWDEGRLDEAALEQSFAYFTDNAARMRFNLAEMPHELSKYVVDTRRPIAERQWALQRYGSISEIERVYVDPPYDIRAYLAGDERKIADREYTLENIRRYGGVCHDRAVFASEVAKANGVPCVYVWAPISSGLGHAWVAYLRKRGEGVVWDRDSGRLEGEKIAIGRIRDPQSGRVTWEGDLELGLAALRIPAAKRREARIWCDVASLLMEAGSTAEAIRAIRKSIEVSIHDATQWQVYAKIAQKGGMTPAQVEATIWQFVQGLKEYPGLAFSAFHSFAVSFGKEDSARWLKLYEALERSYGQNIEVLGRLRLMRTQYLESLGKEDAAAKLSADSALETIRNGAVALPLLDNAARLMLKQNRLKEAIALHEQAYYRTTELGSHAFVEGTTRFQVGLRVAKLCLLAGDRNKHESYLKNLVSHFRGTAEERATLAARLNKLRYNDINASSE